MEETKMEESLRGNPFAVEIDQHSQNRPKWVSRLKIAMEEGRKIEIDFGSWEYKIDDRVGRSALQALFDTLWTCGSGKVCRVIVDSEARLEKSESRSGGNASSSENPPQRLFFKIDRSVDRR